MILILLKLGYSELVERVWKNCKESMERNPKDIAISSQKQKQMA